MKKSLVYFSGQTWNVDDAIVREHLSKMPTGHCTLKNLIAILALCYELCRQRPGKVQYVQAFVGAALKRAFQASASNGC